MKEGPNIVRIAALIGDHARAEMLTALMADRALTASELVQVANVTKQTVSAHLAKLLDAQLVAVEHQGRHRYFRLADLDVAQLLESLMGVAYRTGAVRLKTGPREPAMRKARQCYDHLAGELGVLMFDSLEQRQLLQLRAGALELSTKGRTFCRGFGIDLGALESHRRTLCRTCLDWSVRRPHLAGALGAGLLDQCFQRGWARRSKDSRIINFTVTGEQAFRKQFPFRG